MRIKSLTAAICGVAMVGALALPALAADAETGYRYASACTVGSETRPAVTWRAMGEMEITPPGAGYTVDYNSPLQYITRTTGGTMAGGYWVVYSTNDVLQPNTYGSCTNP